MDLWSATLQNITECTQSLFSLVPLTITLLELGSETLKKVLRIIESYIILVPDLSIQVIVFKFLLLLEVKLEINLNNLFIFEIRL